MLYWIILLLLFVPLAWYIIKKTNSNPVRQQRLEQIQQRLREKERNNNNNDETS